MRLTSAAPRERASSIRICSAERDDDARDATVRRVVDGSERTYVRRSSGRKDIVFIVISEQS